MSVGQLDDSVIVLTIDGKELTVDPGEKMCPFQTVNWRHSLAGGFTQSSDGHFAGTTAGQTYVDNRLVRTGDITVDAHGTMTGDLRIVMTGQEALHWRQRLLRNDEAEVRKSFDRWLEEIVPQGVGAHLDHFLGMDDEDVNLMAIVKVEGTLGVATAKRLLLPGFFFETRSHEPFVDQEKRQTAVDMHYGAQIVDQVTYHLPDGMTVEGAPKDDKIVWAGHAVLNDKSAAAAGKVTIARSFSRAFTLVKPDEYQDLRGFYKQVAAADQQQLVLTIPPATKGN